MLYRDIFVLQPLGFIFGIGQHPRQTVGDVDLIGGSAAASHLGELFNLLDKPAMQRLKRHIGTQQDRRNKPALLLKESQEKVFDINLLIGIANGKRLGLTDGFLGLFRQAVEIHSKEPR